MNDLNEWLAEHPAYGIARAAAIEMTLTTVPETRIESENIHTAVLAGLLSIGEPDIAELWIELGFVDEREPVTVIFRPPDAIAYPSRATVHELEPLWEALGVLACSRSGAHSPMPARPMRPASTPLTPAFAYRLTNGYHHLAECHADEVKALVARADDYDVFVDGTDDPAIVTTRAECHTLFPMEASFLIAYVKHALAFPKYPFLDEKIQNIGSSPVQRQKHARELRRKLGPTMFTERSVAGYKQWAFSGAAPYCLLLSATHCNRIHPIPEHAA